MSEPKPKRLGRPPTGSRYTIQVHVYLDAESERLFRALRQKTSEGTSPLFRRALRRLATEEGVE